MSASAGRMQCSITPSPCLPDCRLLPPGSPALAICPGGLQAVRGKCSPARAGMQAARAAFLLIEFQRIETGQSFSSRLQLSLDFSQPNQSNSV